MSEKYTGGSVRQLTGRKGKPWQAILKYKDASGKWHNTTKILPDAKGKKEAQKLCDKWREEMNAAAADRPNASVDTHKGANVATVQDVISNYLDIQLKRGELEKSTYNIQTNNARNHIYPYIGDYEFAKVTRYDIEQWLTTLAEEGMKQGTIHPTYSIVRKTFYHYYSMGEIERTPCEFVKTPKKGGKRVTFLDQEQIDNLFDALNNHAAEGSPFWIAVNLAALSGLRRGEICGLRWSDIDFNRNTLSVTTAIGISKDGFYAKDPKNTTSARTFPMVPQLAQALQSAYQHTQEQYGNVDNGWFVCGSKREYMTPMKLGSDFTRFTREYGLEDHYGKYITLHSLRHNFATLGVKANMDIASLSRMLGHASKSMTLDTYATADPAALKLGAEVLGEAFSNETEYLEK